MDRQQVGRLQCAVEQEEVSASTLRWFRRDKTIICFNFQIQNHYYRCIVLIKSRKAHLNFYYYFLNIPYCSGSQPGVCVTLGVRQLIIGGMQKI